MLVVIRGAGDIATGIALRLYRAGIRLVLTDLPQPTSIRRTVCFSEAIRLGETVVEGVHARRANTAAEAAALTEQGIIAVLADPAAGCVQELHPDALVDAILGEEKPRYAHHGCTDRHCGRSGLYGRRGLSRGG